MSESLRGIVSLIKEVLSIVHWISTIALIAGLAAAAGSFEETMRFMLREWSLYVDFEGEEWFSPFDIEYEDVTVMVTFAENYFKNTERLCEILLKAPRDLLVQVTEYIERQLVPSYLEELKD